MTTQSGPLPLGKGGAARAAGQSSRASVAALPERLHNYAPVAPLPSRGRNPFVYGVRPAPAPVRAQMEGAPAPAPAPVMVAEPPPMAFRLTGVASAFEDGMPSLTALLTVNGAMTFVKAGHQLPGGYTVLRVDETSVVLADAAGVTQTVKLP